MTHSRTRIHELLGEHLSPRRDLGQNFVADPNTVRRIAHLAQVSVGDHVVEIGAGLGSLTLALAETGAHVTAVEVDRGIVPVLREVMADVANVNVVEADATTLDWGALLAASDRWTLVANLPYNIATPLVCDLLDHVQSITSMLVMVQREVAERFAAPPGSKLYGAVSVKVAYWGNARMAATVPASVFVPRPNVESALVRIDRHDAAQHLALSGGVDRERLFSLVRTAFGQRRKMLRRSLASEVAIEQFAAADVSPEDRPEQLGLADWVRLAGASPATSIPGSPATSPVS